MTAYIYRRGAERWRRFNGQGDVRSYQAPKGWSAFAHLVDEHPVTGKPLKAAQWWIREVFRGE